MSVAFIGEIQFLLGGGNSNIFYFDPETWGRFPICLIFFRWVETTNQSSFEMCENLFFEKYVCLPFFGRVIDWWRNHVKPLVFAVEMIFMFFVHHF